MTQARCNRDVYVTCPAVAKRASAIFLFPVLVPTATIFAVRTDRSEKFDKFFGLVFENSVSVESDGRRLDDAVSQLFEGRRDVQEVFDDLVDQRRLNRILTKKFEI